VPEPVRFSLDKLKLQSDSSLDKDLFSSKARLTTAARIGSTKVDRVELVASVKRLHVPTYQRLMNDVMSSSADCTGDPKLNAKLMVEAMRSGMMALLPHNPESSIDKLAIDIDGKHGELSYAVGVNGVTEADLQQAVPASLLGKAEIKADMRLPVAWVEQLAPKLPAAPGAGAPAPEAVNLMLDNLVAQGMLVRDGDYISSSLRIAKGQMLVNGQPPAHR
jgi:uncharacterized protein YdgA (DUF945 family)